MGGPPGFFAKPGNSWVDIFGLVIGFGNEKVLIFHLDSRFNQGCTSLHLRFLSVHGKGENGYSGIKV